MLTPCCDTLCGPKTNILVLFIELWLLIMVFFQLPLWILVLNTPVSLCSVICSGGKSCCSCFVNPARPYCFKIAQVISALLLFCVLLLVLLLRLWTINPSWLLSLQKFPILQIFLPFLEQPCLELHWNTCCGIGCVPVEAFQAGGWDRPSWSASPSPPNACSQGIQLYPRLVIHTVIADTLSCSMLENSGQNSDHSSWQPLWSNQLPVAYSVLISS